MALHRQRVSQAVRYGTKAAADFGVVADGVTDNAAALQALLDLRGVIDLPGGNIVFNSPIKIKAGTVLRGATRGSVGGTTLVPIYTGSEYPIQIDGANGSVADNGWVFNTDLEDLYVDASNVGGSGTHIVNISAVYTCALRRVTVSNPVGVSGRSAIRISKANHLELDGVRVNMASTTKMPTGIDVNSADGPISGLLLKNCDTEICTTGVKFTGTTHAIVANVLSHYAEACETYIDWNSANTQSQLTIIGGLLDCEPNSTGIKLRQSNATIVGTFVGNSPQYALDTAGAASSNAWFVLGGMYAGGVNDPSNSLSLNNAGVINVGGGDRSGTATFGGATTCAVTFPYAMQNANYRVLLGPSDNKTYWVTSKTTTGFTLNASATSSATVDWMIRN